METITIKKQYVTIKGQSTTAKAILQFMVDNLADEVKLTVFRQENPSNIKVPAQLNTYLGHKLLGTYDNDAKTFEAFSIEEEDISEIMTHKSDVQWKNPYSH
ncbi:MAG: hypothetical protein AB1782_03550 [Cyanobacteriota bacterium]